jgi:hypothetical protein
MLSINYANSFREQSPMTASIPIPIPLPSRAKRHRPDSKFWRKPLACKTDTGWQPAVQITDKAVAA